jgi:antitoxin (DNA-binding transcriptional repressor) of toxin-antitoxin stability system
MRTVELEAGSPVAELLQRLRAGEEIMLTEREVPVARLIRVAVPTGTRRFGVAKGRLHVHDDFDAPLEDFQPYTR